MTDAKTKRLGPTRRGASSSRERLSEAKNFFSRTQRRTSSVLQTNPEASSVHTRKSLERPLEITLPNQPLPAQVRSRPKREDRPHELPVFSQFAFASQRSNTTDRSSTLQARIMEHMHVGEPKKQFSQNFGPFSEGSSTTKNLSDLLLQRWELLSCSCQASLSPRQAHRCLPKQE